MLLSIDKFGGTIPRVKDKALLPAGKAQAAVNCRFDEGGIIPLQEDETIQAATRNGIILSLFTYYDAGQKEFFAWPSDVNAVIAPLVGDSFKRVFYTEEGTLKVTDKNLYKQGGMAYPMAWMNPCPPAPAGTPVAAKAGAALNITGVGTNGSTAILDHSTSHKAVSVFGNAEISTGWLSAGSLYFDGNSVVSTSIGLQWSSDWQFGTGQFSIDFSINLQALPGVSNSVGLFSHRKDANNYYDAWISNIAGVYNIGFEVCNNGTLHRFYGPVVGLSTSTKHHIAIIRGWGENTNTDAGWAICVDGNPLTLTFSSDNPAIAVNVPVNPNTATPMFLIGSYYNGTTTKFLTAYVSAFRVSSGAALWTAPFTPPAIITLNPDPTLQETKVYVYTFVNSYGEEGPPSLASGEVVIYDGDPVVISGMDGDPGGNYDVLTKRIYRTNQTSSGTAQFQFVAEVAIALTVYVDTTLDSALGEVLPSEFWDAAPAGITGLIALPDGSLAGYVDNLLCRSVPNAPHAWPVTYQQPTDKSIVGLGSFGTTIVVPTEGQPYLNVGNDPSNTVMEKMDVGLANMSKRSTVQFPDFVAYASPEGLIAIGPGIRENITTDIMTKDDWLTKYNPSTISAFYWEDKYVGFYDNGAGGAGFIFNPKNKELVDLDFFATAGYYNSIEGILYLQVGNNIVALNGQVGINRTEDWTSKPFKFRPSAFAVMKVIAAGYPVGIDVVYPNIPLTVTVVAASEDPIRLPAYLTDKCDVRIYGNQEVTAVYLASAMEELPL